MAERTGIDNINIEIKRRRWKYWGHAFREEKENITGGSLRWTPPGKTRPGRPRGTWQKTVGGGDKSD